MTGYGGGGCRNRFSVMGTGLIGLFGYLPRQSISVIMFRDAIMGADLVLRVKLRSRKGLGSGSLRDLKLLRRYMFRLLIRRGENLFQLFGIPV